MSCGKPPEECKCFKKNKIKGTLSKTTLPKKNAFAIETEPDFPKLHTLTIATGKRGGGKSVAIANLIKKCYDRKYFDRVFLITPTYYSNKEIWDIADINEDDIFEPSIHCIRDIIKIVDAEREEWDLFEYKKKLYKQFEKDIHKPVIKMDPELLIEYNEHSMFERKPEWKYGPDREHPPRLACIIDDCLSTDVMARRTAGLTNLAIRHRHVGKGLGISLFMLVQSYCAQGGVPRVIRENCTHLMLFKINDENQIKKVKEEADLPVSDEDFLKMCNYCHCQPYNFLYLDFAPKDESKRFRSGFGEYLHPNSLNE